MHELTAALTFDGSSSSARAQSFSAPAGSRSCIRAKATFPRIVERAVLAAEAPACLVSRRWTAAADPDSAARASAAAWAPHNPATVINGVSASAPWHLPPTKSNYLQYLPGKNPSPRHRCLPLAWSAQLLRLWAPPGRRE